MGAIGLYTHIQANNLRSALLLAGFPVLLLVIVYGLILALMGAGMLPPSANPFAAAFGMMAAGAPLAVVVSLVWFVIAYFANQTIIDLATGARPVTRKDEPALYNLLENLCISRGIPSPSLRIIESDSLNAFATGLNPKQYSISVTRGLLNTLDQAEIEAVLGHELTHVLNRDVRTMVIASVFAGIITLIAQVMYNAIRWGAIGRSSSKQKGAGLIMLVGVAIAGIGYVLAIVIRMTLSRSREFVADAGSVELTKNPDAMISALHKISGHSQLPAPESLRGMFLENHEEGVMGLFATHPPIEKRIAALVKFAGGRDLPPVEAPPQVEPPVQTSPPEAPARAGPWGAAETEAPAPSQTPGRKGPWG